MDPRVSDAFTATPRQGFLPERSRAHATWDTPIPIGHGQTNSQPRTVADMLNLLEVPPGARVLDVGAGSGWSTALLAHLVGPVGLVIGTERVTELAEFGSANLAAMNRPWASIRLAEPGVLGAPQEAPFDRILVSASARELPSQLIDQLAPGGIMVIPVGTTMVRVRRDDDGEIAISEHGAYTFVPLL